MMAKAALPNQMRRDHWLDESDKSLTTRRL